MKIGIIGAGRVGCACALAAVTRGSARTIVIVDRTRKRAKAVATDLRYGTPLGPKTIVVDGDYDDLADAGLVMITAGINEKAGGATTVIPIGSYNGKFGVTLSLPSIVGRNGVVRTFAGACTNPRPPVS